MRRWALLGLLTVWTAWGQGGLVTGRVVDADGQPAPRVKVQLMAGGFVIGGARRPTAQVMSLRDPDRYAVTTDDQGRFRLLLPPPGQVNPNVYLTVRPLSPGVAWVRGGDLPIGATGACVAEDVVVQVLSGGVSGRVTDVQGRPIPHALVLVPSYCREPLVYTDPEGKFEVTGLPPEPVRVVALVGADRRGEVDASPGQRDRVIVVDHQVDVGAEPPAAELRRYQELCVDLVRRMAADRSPYTSAFIVPCFLAAVDRPAAWELTKAVKEEFHQEQARKYLLWTAAVVEPEEAFADLDRLTDFTNEPDRRQMASWLSALLATRHPQEAAKLREQALQWRAALSLPTDQTMADILQLGSALALGQRAEVERLRPIVGEGVSKAATGFWERLADMAGWLTGPWPEEAQALVARVTDPSHARRVEMVAWRRLAETDPAAAATAFAARYPRSGDPGPNTNNPWYDVCMLTAGEIVSHLAPRDARAAARFAACLPPCEQPAMARLIATAGGDAQAIRETQTAAYRAGLAGRVDVVNDPRFGPVQVSQGPDLPAAAAAARAVFLIDPALGRQMYQELLTPRVQAALAAHTAGGFWAQLAPFDPNAACVQTERWLTAAATSGRDAVSLADLITGLVQYDFRGAVDVVRRYADQHDPAHNTTPLQLLAKLGQWLEMSPAERRALRWRRCFPQGFGEFNRWW